MGGRARAGRVRAPGDRRLDGERGEPLVCEKRRQREPHAERQCRGPAADLLCGGPQRAHQAVRVAERHAHADQRVRQLDREQVGGERGRDPVAIRRERGDRRRQRREQQLERVGRVEHGFLVLLQILLVRAGQALHERGQALGVGEEPRALSAGQLEQVGIALLREQARAGGEAVGRGEPAERRRAEEHEVFPDPRQVHAHEPGGVQVLEREVAVAYSVQRVHGQAREAEPRGQRRAIVAKRRARNGAGSERQPVRPLARFGEALLVAGERFHVRQPPMGEPHRLRRLEVRVRRAREVARRARLRHERALQLAHARHGRVTETHHVHAQERRHLIVPRPPGVQPARGIATALDQEGLDRGVDVLAGELGAARAQVGLQGVARTHERFALRFAHHAALGERRRVCAGKRQLLGDEPRVHGERVVERLGARVEACGQPGLPHGLRSPLLGGLLPAHRGLPPSGVESLASRGAPPAAPRRAAVASGKPKIRMKPSAWPGE